MLIGTISTVTILIWIVAAATLRASWGVADELAHAASLAAIGSHPQTTIVYDRNNQPAFTFYVEQRVDVPLDRVSQHMVDALLSVEDRRFYQHHGLDRLRIVKAAWRNWRAGRILEGGSTLTQQLARLEQLTPRRTFDRKIREVAIAVRLEERYSKDGDSQRVSERGLFRRRIPRRRGGVARLLRQAGRRSPAARSGAARGAGAIAERLFAERCAGTRARSGAISSCA